MAGVRKALIVATDQYSDPKLTRLNAPAEDARALAEVLRDPDVGAYEVETVLNKTCQEVEIAIARFFQAGARDDTLLVHFSCHGVKDLSGELYFATTDTNLQLLKVTGVASSVVKDAMEESRASLILCLVDCCYSGAFTKSTKAAATVDLTERLGGRGRAVITASTSLQLALDGQEEPSLFTHAVVEGLRSGEADRDLDGLVTLDEFYSYIHDKVTEKNPDQTPVKSFDVQGEVYVARRGGPITTPAPLPRDLLDTLATGEDWQRFGAVSQLSLLLNAGHPGRALGARLALEKVRDHDDSNRVRNAAAAALEGAGDTESIPQIPDYHEPVGTRSATIAPDSGGVGLADVPGAATPIATEPGGGGSATEPGQDVDGGGGGFPRWAIPVGAAVAMLVLVVAVWGVVQYTGDDSEGDAKAESISCEGGGGAGGSTLPTSELLTVLKDGGTRQLVALDVDSGECRLITTDEVALPTISNDRRRLFYLLLKGEPRRMEADGLTDRAALLRPDQRAQCPFSTRPAEVSDGGRLALVCKDESKTVRGLFVVDSNGSNLVPVVEDSTPANEGPTWDNGTGNVIFVAFPNGPADPSRLMTVPPAEGSTPTEIDTGLADWWLRDPDWSNSGLLFLRSRQKDEPGDVMVIFNGDDGATQLTTDVDAKSPTWSPDGRYFAFLAPDSEDPGQPSIWVQEARGNAPATEFRLDGIPGPPAWGPR